MSYNLFNLILCDKRDIPEQELESARNNSMFCMNRKIWGCNCNVKAKYMYIIMSTLLDSDDEFSILDLQYTIINTSSKKDGRYYKNKDNVINAINDLVNCGMVSYDENFVYVY